MSDHERWDETRRVDPDETRRLGPSDAGGSDPDRTHRLGPNQPAPGRAGEGAEPTQHLDAVGDSTYEDPYGDPTHAEPGDPAAEEVAEEEPARRRDGLRTTLMLLLGAGIGFLAALVVVALFGGEGPDADAVALRDARIAELEEELEQSEERNAELEDSLEQRDEQIADLQEGLEDAEGDLAERQQALDDREQQLDQREQQVEQREQDVAEREQEQGEAPPDDDPDDDPDNGVELPDVEEDAEAFIDRVIEGIRDLFD